MTQSDNPSTIARPDGITNATSSSSLLRYYEERLAKVRKDLPVIAAELKDAGVARVDIVYDGCGDSGQIEDVRYFDEERKWIHAQSSVRRFGGKVEDYAAIHDWQDATKETFCDFRHRALRHHSQGVFEAERVFGMTIRNSDGRQVPTRYIAEQHIKEDCGGIVPSVSDWLSRIRSETWMSRGYSMPSNSEG